MSPETVASQTTPMDSQGPVDNRLHTRSGDSVELSTTKGTSDVKAGGATSPLASSTGEGAAENPAEDASTSQRAKTFAVLRAFVILVALGLGFALLYGPALYALGATTLNGIFHVAPFTSVNLVQELIASLAGAPGATLAVGTIASVDIVLRRLPRLGRDQLGIAECLDEMATVVGALSSVFATPLGFVMMPHLAMEEFGAWHALAVTATGLAVLGAMLLCCLFVVLLVLL